MITLLVRLFCQNHTHLYIVFLALVQWAKEQVEVFAELFRSQVHGGDVSPQTVRDCLDVTRLQGKKVVHIFFVQSMPN